MPRLRVHATRNVYAVARHYLTRLARISHSPNVGDENRRQQLIRCIVAMRKAGSRNTSEQFLRGVVLENLSQSGKESFFRWNWADR